ncbi:MAG TPA: L,D-transpeptidase [Ktedonobacterales bacterium]|nr:L,D-transpeptidase [Ktedonobacterales bacterium]
MGNRMWTRKLGPLLLLLVVALAPAACAPRSAVSSSVQLPVAAPQRASRPTAPLLATHSRAQAVMSCQTPSAPSAVMDVKLLQQPFVLDGGPASCALLRLVIPAPAGGVPAVGGQLILVNLTQQWLWAYQDGALVTAMPITSGQPYLWTPEGTYHVLYKVQNTTFYSPWGPGSPWYYSPEHVDYALFFRDKGYFIHDAPWRHAFGPGTDVQHTDPDGTQETGSHGCVNMPPAAGQWLYTWANPGATIVITA